MTRWRRQSHHWIHAADQTIARKWRQHGTQRHRIYSTARPNVVWIKCWGDLITNGRLFSLFIPPASSVKEIGEKISCARLAATWHCANYKYSRPRGAGDDGQQFELQQRPDACRGDGTQLRGEWNRWSHVWSQGGICGLQTRVDKSRDYWERQHGSRRRFRSSQQKIEQQNPIQKFLNRLNCYCSSFTIISNKKKIGGKIQKDAE